MTKMKNFFLLALLFLLSSLVTLFAVNYSFLFYEKHLSQKETSAHQFFSPNDDFGYFHKPFSHGLYTKKCFSSLVKINSQGLRDTEHSVNRINKNSKRILILGDSTTEGLQVELNDVYSKQAETILNSSNKGEFETINFGMSSFGTDQEYQIFKKIGQKYNPDILVLSILPTNDILNNSQKLNGIESPKTYFKLDKKNHLSEIRPFCKSRGLMPCESKKVKSEKVSFEEFLHEKFALFRWVEKKIKANTNLNLFLYNKFSIFKPKELELNYDVYKTDLNSDWIEAWAVTEELIRSFKKEALNKKMKFIVMLFPDKSEILGIDYLQRNYPLTNLSGYDLQYPNNRLSGFLLKEDIDFIDIQKIFLAEYYRSKNIDNLFLSCDGHYTKYGHKLIAENLSILINKINFN